MEIAEVWRPYCCRLFSGNTNNETSVAVLEGSQKEPDILRTEGKGTKEQILNVCQVIEKARDFNVCTYVPMFCQLFKGF